MAQENTSMAQRFHPVTRSKLAAPNGGVFKPADDIPAIKKLG